LRDQNLTGAMTYNIYFNQVIDTGSCEPLVKV